MAVAQAAIRHLETIERGTASPGEREAADWIAERLRSLGADAHTESEQVHGGYWIPVGAPAAAAAGLALLALRGGAVARLAALAGGTVATASILDDISGGLEIVRTASGPSSSSLQGPNVAKVVLTCARPPRPR